jgi:hypothetical protein
MAEDDNREKQLIPVPSQLPQTPPPTIGPPPRNNQWLLILFALLTSNLLALLLGFLFEFASLRNIVDVAASRIMLVGAWAIGVFIVCLIAWRTSIRPKVATAISGSLLLGVLLWGLDAWAPKPKLIPRERVPYPWVSARGTILGNPMRVQLELTVREYPPSQDFIERNILPISTIFAVHVDLFTHLRMVEPGDGEDICSYPFDRLEFRNELRLQGQLGYITLDKDVTAVTLRESARNGVWDGYIVFYRQGNSVDYEQVLHGTVISSVDGSQHNMTVKEARRGGRVLRDPRLPDRLTNGMLKSYGLPVVGTDRPRFTCPSLALSPTFVPKPTFTEARRDFVLIAGGSSHKYPVNKSSTAADPSRIKVFGETIPALSAYVEDDRLFVDTQLYYARDKPPLQLVHNEVRNRPPEWDSNSDKTAIEIVDESKKPRFQLIYHDPHTVLLRGIFQFENRAVVLEEDKTRFLFGSGADEMETGPIFMYPSRLYKGKEVPNVRH